MRLCSSLPQARRRLEAWSFWCWQPPSHMMSRWKRPGLSGSWETFCVYALFLDPGRTSPPGHYGGSARPPHGPTARAPTMTQFRGSIAEPEHSLFTLRREHHYPTTQNSLPGAGQALPDGFGYPLGLSERFPSCFPTSLPPFPSFPDAMAHWAKLPDKRVLNYFVARQPWSDVGLQMKDNESAQVDSGVQ